MTGLTPAQAAEQFRQQVGAMGMAMHPQSRLAKMVSVLMTGDDRIGPDHRDYSVVMEAYRDIQMLHFAVAQLAKVIPPSDLRGKMTEVSKDPVLPQDNLKRSPGRDCQMELYVAGMCAKGGMTPRFREPDLVCSMRGNLYGVAVKRLKSLDRFEEHFRKATDQIERSRLPGFIVADFTTAFNRANQPVTEPMPEREIKRRCREIGRSFLAEHFRAMKGWIRGREVRGFFMLFNHVRNDPKEGWLLESFIHSVCFSEQNQRRRREFLAFDDAFVKGTPTPSIPLSHRLEPLHP